MPITELAKKKMKEGDFSKRIQVSHEAELWASGRD